MTSAWDFCRAEQVIQVLGASVDNILGDPSRQVREAKPLGEGDSESITFCSAKGEKALSSIRASSAGLIICHSDLTFEPGDYAERTLIQVEDPRLEFVRVLNAFFATPPPQPSVHPTSVVHPEAKVHPSVYIGPFCSVGRCEIGEKSVIYGHVHIYDGVKIGRNVIIHAGCVIGADGFGFARNESGELEKFPQIAGVVIEDEVELQAMVHVACGTLGDTHIGMGTKIDSGCHIAHNVRIGKHCAIAAHTMFSGSVTLGDRCFVGPLTAFRDHITVGDEVTIGFASVVTKDIPDNSFIMGSPARPLDEYKKILSAMKEVAGID